MPDEVRRAHAAEAVLFEGVVSLEGAISGEHGIGFAKAALLQSPVLARCRRVDEAA